MHMCVGGGKFEWVWQCRLYVGRPASSLTHFTSHAQTHANRLQAVRYSLFWSEYSCFSSHAFKRTGPAAGSFQHVRNQSESWKQLHMLICSSWFLVSYGAFVWLMNRFTNKSIPLFCSISDCVFVNGSWSLIVFWKNLNHLQLLSFLWKQRQNWGMSSEWMDSFINTRNFT